VLKNALNLDEAVKAIGALEVIGITINNLNWMDFKEILKIASSAKLYMMQPTFTCPPGDPEALLLDPL
jgi:hypothetical protein